MATNSNDLLLDNWWFVLGREPLLSLAEILNLLKLKNAPSAPTGPVFVCHGTLDAPTLIMRLGGTIKIGKQIFSNLPEAELEQNILKDLETIPGKIIFGFSFYENTPAPNFKRLETITKLGKNLKTKLKSIGRSARFVFNNETVLSSVTVEKNGLTKRGREYLLTEKNGLYGLAVTKAIQPFKMWGDRDYGRPGRDDLSGMLPPKLARLMVNLSSPSPSVGASLLDPFCGFGSILQEAALSGFDVRGMDIEKNCVDASIQNLEWLEKEYKIQIPGIRRKVIQGNAKRLSQYFENESIDGIVAEPYMGPALKAKPDAYLAKNILQELSPMYEAFFRGAAQILKDKGRICIVSPRFQTQAGTFKIDIDRLGAKFGFRTVDILKPYKIQHQIPALDFEERHKLIREINVLEKF